MKVPSGPQQQAGCAHLSGTPPQQLKAAAAATPERGPRASMLQTLDQRRDSFESKGLDVELAAKRLLFVSPLRPLNEAFIDEGAAAASAKPAPLQFTADPAAAKEAEVCIADRLNLRRLLRSFRGSTASLSPPPPGCH